MPLDRCLRRMLGGVLAALLASAAVAADAPPGQGVYERQCIACHQSGGSGLPGFAPALAGPLAPLLGSEDGRRYVAQVLTHGLSGRIVSKGQVYMGAMPSQTALPDADLAAVANYVARDLNGTKGALFSADDFARARTTKSTHKGLRELRDKVLR